MKGWWDKLAPHERMKLLGAVLAVGILLIYGGVWYPLSSAITRLERSAQENRATKQWMERAALEAKGLQAESDPPSSKGDHRSLLAIVDETSKQAALGPAVKHIEPENQENVKITLEQASFDDMMTWLGSLQRFHHIQVAELSVDREGDGLVGARITLRKTPT